MLLSYHYNIDTAKFTACDASQTLTTPLLINWNIIGNCCNECVYCYGKDIKNVNYCKTQQELKKILEHLAYIKPLAVVITGGEPMLHPQIKHIIDYLSGFTNVIMDSNGLLLTEDFLIFCKKNRVHLRISLDSDIPSINSEIRRCQISNSTEKIKNILRMCKSLGIYCTVQTVVTSKNVYVLESLRFFLKNIGIKHWRLLDVITDEDESELTVKTDELENFLKKHKTCHNDIYISYLDEKEVNCNNIILVDPVGKYFYRSAGYTNKILVDSNTPTTPTLEILMSGLNIEAHIRRYTIFEVDT